MRWIYGQRVYEERVRKCWFAIWPISISGETRWLEWVNVEFWNEPYFTGDGYTAFRYTPSRFVNE